MTFDSETQNSSQIKSKSRVANHGEVFTNPREVNAMLDLVKDETLRIDSRFLEPACGNGNFLIEILHRKLDVVNKISTSETQWLTNCAIAFSSIYGIELLSDNAKECRERLFNFFVQDYYSKKIKSKDKNEKYLRVIQFLLQTNIICGDALNLTCNDGTPLIFAEWGWVNSQVQRRDFALNGLLSESKANITKKDNDYERSLFDDVPDEDFENAGLIKENVYPLIHYMELVK